MFLRLVEEFQGPLLAATIPAVAATRPRPTSHGFGFHASHNFKRGQSVVALAQLAVVQRRATCPCFSSSSNRRFLARASLYQRRASSRSLPLRAWIEPSECTTRAVRQAASALLSSTWSRIRRAAVCSSSAASNRPSLYYHRPRRRRRRCRLGRQSHGTTSGSTHRMVLSTTTTTTLPMRPTVCLLF
jgi:hypothetical protein